MREDQIEEFAWMGRNARNDMHPVGQKKPNEWGLYDMQGNVAEFFAGVVARRYGGRRGMARRPRRQHPQRLLRVPLRIPFSAADRRPAAAGRSPLDVRAGQIIL